MSSAILYLAIVAIWACVLIPRWLRRDSTRGVPAPAPAPVAAPVAAEPDLEAEDDLEAGDDDFPADDGEGEAEMAFPAPVAGPLGAEAARRRMLAARRRLLLMLIGLEIAAVTLAVLKLAAIWVVVPPSVMLAGYLLLLREAAQADAERAEREAEAAAYARERELARLEQARRATPVEGTTTEGIAEAAAALAAKFAAAPVPADYEDSGRDFAPGLAGKYMTSNADAESAELAAEPGDDYDTYDRAVGD